LTRRLLLINLTLLALASAGIWRLRIAWRSETARERAAIGKPIHPLPPPLVAGLPPAQAVRPVDYIDIAQKDLFTRDRNPNILVETKAPPPKPMPALPLFHGVMNLGDGPTAILSEKKGAPHRDFRPGEQIGEFKLVAVNREEIVLEWDGQQIRKRLEELQDTNTPAPASGNTAAQATAPAAPPAAPAQAKPEPGVDVGQGVRACQSGDNSPPGTVANGMRKRTQSSPFGERCWWEPAQ
jgi:hypothetical protein